MLNQTIIVGRLVKDPELKVTDTGKKVTKIRKMKMRIVNKLNGRGEQLYGFAQKGRSDRA